MAEIPVVRKSKSSFPWWLIPLLLILLVLGGIYYFYSGSGANNPSSPRSAENTANGSR